jgi:hypothetical protein
MIKIMGTTPARIAACVCFTWALLAGAQPPTTTGTLETTGSAEETTAPVEETTAPIAIETPAPEPQRITPSGINLVEGKWYASADLPPDAPIDEIVAKATPTTPTVTLRTNPGGSGTLFTVIQVSGKPALGAELIIGDIDGNDEVFFNGTRVGATSGWGVADNGIPRTYYIEPKLFVVGRNILAIRLTGIGGRGSFGIKREPMTLAFVTVPPLPEAYINPKPLQGVTGIPESAARAAIATMLGETSEPVRLMRKRPSFGRFGKFFHDGLPAVREISPTHIENRDGPKFDVALDRIDDLALATGNGEPGIDGWHKLSRVEGSCSQRPVRYTMLQSLLYPGGVISLEQGTVLQLRISFPRGQGVLQAVPEAEIAAALPGAAKADLSVFLLYEPQKEAVPVILVAAGAAANVTQAEGHIDATFSRGAASRQPARIFIMYPTGLRQADLSGRANTFAETMAAIEPGSSPGEALSRWMRLALNVPTGADEYFNVDHDAGLVRIFQVTRYEDAAKLEPGPPMIPVPPQITFAREAFDYPAVTDPLTSAGVLTFSGPLLVCDPVPKPHDGIYVTSYTLPIPPLDERGLLVDSESVELRDLVNQHLTDLGTTTSATGVDLLYKSRTQGFQAFSYLTPENRKRLIDNSDEIVAQGLRESVWNEAVEPFSGLRFWWTYFIEGPYFDRYDQDWGNGLSLIGLHTYAKYTGNWELVARRWDAVEKMFSWFPATDDWEWMRASNGLHGHGTGAGDCQSATYAGVLAYAKLARSTGRSDDFDYGVYTAARAAILSLNRLAYSPFGRRNGFSSENAMVLGFHEGHGFLVGELDAYPWNVTSMISGNGVQPENFYLYQRYAPDALRNYERAFEAAYPNWMDGTYVYPRPTIYRNHSGYITLPHIYLRARLGLDGYETLVDHVNRAKANTHLWWLAPPVLAEVMNTKASAHVSDWGRCAFLGGGITHEKKRRRLEAKFENNYAPDTVEFVMPHRPFQVQINDGPVPLTDSAFENLRLRVKLRRPGLNTITVIY